MARAKRHYIPDQIWHITQRCHKREFQLKWRAGRTAQEYNRRKRRKGAFWEDRYHSTPSKPVSICCDVWYTSHPSEIRWIGPVKFAALVSNENFTG